MPNIEANIPPKAIVPVMLNTNPPISRIAPTVSFSGVLILVYKIIVKRAKATDCESRIE